MKTTPHSATRNSAIVYAVATLDTKSEELQYVVARLQEAGIPCCVVDVSTGGGVQQAEWAENIVGPWHILAGTRQHSSEHKDDGPSGARAPSADLRASQGGLDEHIPPDRQLEQLDRGSAVTRMAAAFAKWIGRQAAAGHVAGMIGIGGSGGTAIITAGMRQLPVGVPKLMVSTVASGNTSAYVDCSDICMMASVVDVCGLNAVSRRVLSNAAHAMAGMVQQTQPVSAERPAVGMTMFGVTTPCVSRVRQLLEDRGFDCLVFHATGTGGRAMEKLVASGLLQGVLDITTTEVADEIVGGVFSAGPDRMDVLIRSGIPLVVSSGALDMVNFGSRESVPSQFSARQLHVHNPQVTLMRTTVEETRQAARWIAEKLKPAQSGVTVMLPENGVSSLDHPGQAFYNPAATQAFGDTLEHELADHPHAVIRRLPLHINDEAFAVALVDAFLEAVKPVAAS